MSTYTKNLDDIYFLNDKNIVQELHGVATPDINAVPSLSLLQDVCRDLSCYTNDLSGSLSNTLSAIRDDLKNADISIVLSVNGISAKVNQICSDISVKADAIQLSVSGLSDAVEAKFVHKSGDIIDGKLTIRNDLSITDNVTIDNDTIISKSLYVGSNNPNTTIAKNNILIGNKAKSIYQNTFVWNATDNEYSAHEIYSGNGGSFNINPSNGAYGFYIGEETLSDIIKNDVKHSYDTLAGQINSTSSYIVDNYALSNDIPLSVSQLMNDSGYLISDDFNAEYDPTSKKIIFYAGSKTYDVDATAFIKDGMLSSASLTYTREDPHGEKGPWLKLVFNTDAGKDTIYIDLENLVDIYTAGTAGINVADYKISLDFDVVGKKTDIVRNSNNIETLSNAIPVLSNAIDTVSAQTGNIQDYVNQLRGVEGYNPGIIPTLCTDICVLQEVNIRNVKFTGYIKDLHESKSLTDLLTYYNLVTKGGVLNGSFIKVNFGANYPISTVYETADNLKIKINDGDYLFIYNNAADYTIALEKITADDVKVLHPDIGRAEYEQFKSFISAEVDRISSELSTELCCCELSVNGLSVRTAAICAELSTELCCCELSVNGLSTIVNRIRTELSTELCCCELSVKGLSARTAAICAELSTELCCCKLSAIDCSEKINKISLSVNGLSARANEICAELSTAISSKIWIKDIESSIPKYDNGTASDLSIIKIKKDEYDAIVANAPNTLCSNVLYIVSADYMDAYGQCLSNLAMSEYKDSTGEYIVAEATNKHYVDSICTDLSVEVQNLSTALSSNVNAISASLSNEIGNVRTIFRDLYSRISTININSYISDVISAVVEIKSAISVLTAY